jgi:hypothetical protein
VSAVPVSLDVAAAAAYVLVVIEDGLVDDVTKSVTLAVWRLLVGLSDDDALAYARQIAPTNQRAALIPF